jgi:hypothetical protein
MQSHALPMDPIWQPARWVPEWLKNWITALLKSQPDRREASRKLVANVTAHYWEGSGAAGHVVRDISTSGAFIYADFLWMPGTILTMTLQRENHIAGSGSPVSVVLRGKVVRQAERGVGVQFVYSDKGERKALEDFLQGIPDAVIRWCVTGIISLHPPTATPKAAGWLNTHSSFRSA